MALDNSCSHYVRTGFVFEDGSQQLEVRHCLGRREKGGDAIPDSVAADLKSASSLKDGFS